MADDGIEDRQRDEELADDDPVAVAVREHAKELHTALPGIVKSFDRGTLTAKVQPAIKRRWREAGFLALPELVDCPVQMLRSGNFVLWMEPVPNDECYVSFSERAIDNWHHASGVQEPSEYRLHDYSDGFCFPGFWSKPEAAKITNLPPPGAVELRTLDGATVLRVEQDMVTAGAIAGAQRATLGEKLQEILDALKTHTHPATSGTTSASVELAAILDWDTRASKVKVS